MAYNLQSLITILEKILDPEQKRWIIDHNKKQVKSLLEKAISLQKILEKSSLPKIEISLEIQIKEAAHKAEDIIESRMVDQILCTSLIGWLISWCKCYTFSSPDLQQVIQELDSAMAQVMKLVEVEGKNTSSDSSSTTRASISSLVVGVDEDLMQLKDRLTGMQSKLEIIPIVGMGGIGKTTLARKLYEDSSIIYRFTARAWTTMSQDYNMKAILLDLVQCINGKENDNHGAEWDNLYRSLFGRRYLIVIDDIWSKQTWDDIRRYFPDNNNGSRIVITTRESDVAKHAGLGSPHHQVQLLSESMSWNLLRQIVFGEEEDYPYVLEEIGKKIANGCEGLPLAINVIGGLLSKLQRTKHVWQNIAKDVRAAIADSDEQVSKILSLSYNHLPNHLKPCFLYMSAFPKYYSEVKGSALVRLWLGEGFLKSNGDDKSLEEEAEDCLKALVERNLLMVKRNKSNGKPSSYIIHDLLRDMCMSKAKEEKFLHVFKNSPELTLPKLRRARASVSRGMEAMYASTEFMSLARTFLCTDIVLKDIIRGAVSASRLLRVLDIEKEKFRKFPTEILQLVNLRYLAFSCDESLPDGISRLLNLQTLIAELRFCFGPSEVWEMLELRHVKFNRAFWTGLDKQKTSFVLKKKMQTISRVGLSRSLISWGFLESIPNIKKLGIYFDDSAMVDLSHLPKLETLTCESGSSHAASFFLRNLRFPSGLRKLNLYGGVIFVGVLKALYALPDLESLRMKGCKFAVKAKGADVEWEAEEGDEFRSLQFLSLEKMNVKRWGADETNFPKLRGLTVWKCPELEEIPSAIGEITALESILVGGCSDSVVESAKQIQEEQAENGNYGLQLRIIS